MIVRAGSLKQSKSNQSFQLNDSNASSIHRNSFDYNSSVEKADLNNEQSNNHVDTAKKKKKHLICCDNSSIKRTCFLSTDSDNDLNKPNNIGSNSSRIKESVSSLDSLEKHQGSSLCDYNTKKHFDSVKSNWYTQLSHILPNNENSYQQEFEETNLLPENSPSEIHDNKTCFSTVYSKSLISPEQSINTINSSKQKILLKQKNNDTVVSEKSTEQLYFISPRYVQNTGMIKSQQSQHYEKEAILKKNPGSSKTFHPYEYQKLNKIDKQTKHRLMDYIYDSENICEYGFPTQITEKKIDLLTEIDNFSIQKNEDAENKHSYKNGSRQCSTELHITQNEEQNLGRQSTTSVYSFGPSNAPQKVRLSSLETQSNKFSFDQESIVKTTQFTEQKESWSEMNQKSRLPVTFDFITSDVTSQSFIMEPAESQRTRNEEIEIVLESKNIQHSSEHQIHSDRANLYSLKSDYEKIDEKRAQNWFTNDGKTFCSSNNDFFPVPDQKNLLDSKKNFTFDHQIVKSVSSDSIVSQNSLSLTIDPKRKKKKLNKVMSQLNLTTRCCLLMSPFSSKKKKNVDTLAVDKSIVYSKNETVLKKKGKKAYICKRLLKKTRSKWNDNTTPKLHIVYQPSWLTTLQRKYFPWYIETIKANAGPWLSARGYEYPYQYFLTEVKYRLKNKGDRWFLLVRLMLTFYTILGLFLLNIIFKATLYVTFSVPQIQDYLHDITRNINAFIRHDSMIFSIMILFSSLCMDSVVCLSWFQWLCIGDSFRLPIAYLLFYSLRAFFRLLCVLPYPPGYIWHAPTFGNVSILSLSVPYQGTNDFFFSGHVGCSILCAIEHYYYRFKFGVYYTLFVATLQFFVLIITRGHYTIDLLTGILAAHWTHLMARRLAAPIDQFLGLPPRPVIIENSNDTVKPVAGTDSNCHLVSYNETPSAFIESQLSQFTVEEYIINTTSEDSSP